jgi:RNA polymerase sigma-70 factor (ECF subfamily)
VAALPVEQREVFLMREVMDMPFADIAAAVGASEPTVKSRMRYALTRLRQALDELRDSGAHPVAVSAEQSS